MEEYEILEELKMHIRCSDFAQNLYCDGVSVDFLKSTLDLILKQKAEIEKNKPVADVAPVKHGGWMVIDDTGFYKYYLCNQCNKVVTLRTRYCPKCGAKMDEEEQDE